MNIRNMARVESFGQARAAIARSLGWNRASNRECHKVRGGDRLSCRVRASSAPIRFI